jgi:hypothetical protein
MPLTIRPTNLQTSPVYQHLKDYTVFDDGTEIGRIYEQRSGAPAYALWIWSITALGPGRGRMKIRRSGAYVRGCQRPICRKLGRLQGRSAGTRIRSLAELYVEWRIKCE